MSAEVNPSPAFPETAVSPPALFPTRKQSVCPRWSVCSAGGAQFCAPTSSGWLRYQLSSPREGSASPQHPWAKLWVSLPAVLVSLSLTHRHCWACGIIAFRVLVVSDLEPRPSAAS